MKRQGGREGYHETHGMERGVSSNAREETAGRERGIL